MQVVAGERVDGELAAVAAQPAARPGLVGGVAERVVPRRDRLGRRHQLGGRRRPGPAGRSAPRRRSRPGPSWRRSARPRSSIRASRSPKMRCTSRTWQAYSSGDQVCSSGRSVAPGWRSTAAQPVASSRSSRAEVGRGRASAATKPHSGQAPSRTQVQSLVSGSMAGLGHGPIIMEPVTVRSADPADLPRIAAIYDEQVRTAISTFDLEPPADVLLGGPAGQHRAGRPPARRRLARPARWWATPTPRRTARGRRTPAPARSRSTSTTSARGQGLGRQLYDELLGRLRADGVHQVLAVIALPNDASEALHRACGFSRVGLLPEVGWKFDRWIDTACGG